MSLEHFKSFNLPLSALLTPPPPPDPTLPPLNARQRYFADLADYWLSGAPPETSRQARLSEILRQQLLAQIALREGDHTLGSGHAELMSSCVTLPLPSQRQHLPAAQRPQVYRPVLSITTPHWRSPLRGAFVIVEGGPEGGTPDPRQPGEYALLCSLSHGIEAFDSLAELHVELCERLDDPQQSRPLLRHLHSAEDRERACNAERLRYEWFNDDLVQAQVQDLIDGQRAALTALWDSAARSPSTDLSVLAEDLQTAADVLPWIDSRSALRTRYGLLLERNSPAWLRHASAQGLTHIMQTMQELVVAIDRASAPGILNRQQFVDRNGLLSWTRDRLRVLLRQRHQLDLDPLHLYVSVTLARQTGPVLHPGITTAWIPVASRPQLGDSVELVRRTYRFDELALLNVSLLDIDYWLTARVHDEHDRTVPGITPSQVRSMVRELNVGESYSRYLRTHLLTSAQAQWRRDRYVDVSRARMRAELAKAHYAGHLLEDPFERGFKWASLVLDNPDAQVRKRLPVQRLSVRQLLLAGHSLHDVMLITPDGAGFSRVLVYTPDAPDRRAWREFRNIRHLLRTLRSKPALREYVKERLPLLDPEQVERWLTKGGLGAATQRPEITGDFQHARYLAEVNATLARVDASTHTKLELLGELTLHALSILLDLISLVIPARTLVPVALARSILSVIDASTAFKEDDRIGVLKHLVESFTHVSDAVNNIGGTTVMRRAIRAIPPTPPLKLPPAAAISIDSGKLHYRVDGIHKEGIYEQPSAYPGLSLYYIKDASGASYQVAFDGYRWRVVDPRMPDAYIKLPVKRREDGEWVVDSPVVWYDGLPDLTMLLADCQLAELPVAGPPVAGLPGWVPYPGGDGLFQSDRQLYLLAGEHALPLRAHLLDDHYHLLIPGQANSAATAWAILRWQDGQWRIRVRQAGRSSDWLALPAAYSVRRGSSASRR
ncbi:dermonecrotic toxin domain-containing protein [Pseudomonas phoenicis]|uniref:dermonecrotic toxin domain-containing protein n=1 Tax=unclassified Pseudomonas TaxID=196821 RepID=UPI00399F35DA